MNRYLGLLLFFFLAVSCDMKKQLGEACEKNSECESDYCRKTSATCDFADFSFNDFLDAGHQDVSPDSGDAQPKDTTSDGHTDATEPDAELDANTVEADVLTAPEFWIEVNDPRRVDLTLKWKVPDTTSSDVGLGPIIEFELRYSLNHVINRNNFDNADAGVFPIPNDLEVTEPGSTLELNFPPDSCPACPRVTLEKGENEWRFAVRGLDENGLASDISVATLDSTLSRDVYTPPPGLTQYQYGDRVVNVGDVNRDGYEDFVVRNWVDNYDGSPSQGALYIYYGANSLTSMSYQEIQKPANCAFAYGQSIVSGDFNGDGFKDIAVSCFTGDYYVGSTLGNVYIFRGSETGIRNVPDTTIEGITKTFGFNMGAAKLHETDAYSDDLFIVDPFDNFESPGYPAPGQNKGWIFYGRPTWLETYSSDDAEVKITGGELPGIQFVGTPYGGLQDTIANGADINNDGFQDLLIGAGAWTDGSVIVLYGGTYLAAPGTFTWSALKTSVISQSDTGFGDNVTGGHDVTGDDEGLVDMIVGAPWAANIFIYRGCNSRKTNSCATGGKIKEVPLIIPRQHRFVRAIPDFNGDSVGDILIGTSRNYCGDKYCIEEDNAGQIHLILGGGFQVTGNFITLIPNTYKNMSPNLFTFTQTGLDDFPADQPTPNRWDLGWHVTSGTFFGAANRPVIIGTSMYKNPECLDPLYCLGTELDGFLFFIGAP